TRTNDPAYMNLVRIFYERIFREVEGLFIKDGGPIIGVQIENEYGHCGGLTGEEGEKHMKALLSMAREIGYDVPLYTATGWGGAVTGGMLPVMGGYCEAPWDQRLTEIEPSGNYIFTEERNDHAIGSDHGIGEGITFDMHAFPYLTAELGGGLQVTRRRRPVASGRDTEAMSLVKLGSGCNLLGYYMYHGGTNPKGKLTTLQESRETGYPNDLPILSYDFNAPIREYGQLTDAYRRIRRLSMFIKDFGEDLCGMDYIPQEGNPGRPEDLTSLRKAVRSSDRGGYLFVSDYQRRRKMKDHPDVSLQAFDREGKLLADFGREDVKDGDIFFYPFDMPLSDGNLLKTVNAVPLCILHGPGEDIYVFYAREGKDPSEVIYQIEAGIPGRRRAQALTLMAAQALHGVKVFLGGRERLLVSEDDIAEEADGSLTMICRVREERKPSFRAYPPLQKTPEGFERVYEAEDRSFADYRALKPLANPVRAELLQESPGDAGEDLKASLHLE
ncbi:MAG: beta-galactosidase, partial [Lachnospiraceae bacterium]|nr:beta-galactosidase [Lachnospiraceae bacterium]